MCGRKGQLRVGTGGQVAAAGGGLVRWRVRHLWCNRELVAERGTLVIWIRGMQCGATNEVAAEVASGQLVMCAGTAWPTTTEACCTPLSSQIQQQARKQGRAIICLLHRIAHMSFHAFGRTR